MLPTMRHSVVALVLCACAGSPPAPQAAAKTASAAAPSAPSVAARKSILLMGNKIGTSVTTVAADGTITNVVDVHDNGRGPHADATIRLAPDGTIAYLEAKGHTELKAPVDEHYSLTNGHAKWASLEEHGEADVKEPTSFVPNSATDADAYLIAALLKNGGTLKLLPGGTAHIEKVGEIDVPVGGKSTHLFLYAITGVSFTPNFGWTYPDGKLFAEVAPGFWSGPEGAESVAEALTAKQEELRKAREKQIAEKLKKVPPAAGFALTHARVLDVEKGAWLADQTVLIVGETIKTVGPSKSAAVPAGAQVIDLGGKAVLPGLWDMHGHLGPADGPLNIASGVTSVRDVGNLSSQLDGLKAQWDGGTAIGPHVYRAGFIEGRGPDAAHTEITATNEAEAKEAVAFFHQKGYDMIKIYNSMDPKLVPVLAKEAHAYGMGVTGHIPCHMLANEAVRAGYDGIEHINQILLNFFADHETDTRTPLRFSLVGDKAADFDPHSGQAQEFWALLREHKTVLDPTFATFEATYIAEQGKILSGWTATVKRLPALVQRAFVTGGLPLEGKKELYARSWKKMVEMAKVFHDEHITLVAGTDYFAGVSLHRELELFVDGGLTPAEALRDATIVPAKVMKVGDKTGTIAAGKVADLVVVDGDPLKSISDVRKTVMTFRGGVAYPAKEVYESVGVSSW